MSQMCKPSTVTPTDLVVDVSFKWKVGGLWHLRYSLLDHVGDVHKVFVKAEPFHQWTVGRQESWVEDKQKREARWAQRKQEYLM